MLFLLVQERGRRKATAQADVNTTVLGSPDPEIVAYRRSAALPIAKWVNPVATASALALHSYTIASEGALALHATEPRQRYIHAVCVSVSAVFAVMQLAILALSGPWRSLKWDEMVWLCRCMILVQTLSIYMAQTIDLGPSVDPSTIPPIAFLFTTPLFVRIWAATLFTGPFRSAPFRSVPFPSHRVGG